MSEPMPLSFEPVRGHGCALCGEPWDGHDAEACDRKMAAWKPTGLMAALDLVSPGEPGQHHVSRGESLSVLPRGTFRCANCGGVFTKGWTDEEAAAEYAEQMPNAATRGDEVDLVCDECYPAVLTWARSQGLEP